MSTSYSLEPVTKGKVVLRTTLGDIEIELWAKESPKAARNFVQLCLEGFYDDCPFHRVVKGFILQTGDPRGDGGESIYGGPFPDEFNQRLRYLRRGLVGMANTGPNSNLSQFFVTLDKTEELNGKNTIFGKVVGETIFNVLKVNDMEVENEQLVTPQRVLSVEVLANPFDDMVPRAKRAAPAPPKPAPASKSAGGAAKKNMALLSFADDAEEEAAEPAPKKGMSAYHFLDDEKVQRELKAQEKEREEMRARAAAAAAAAEAAQAQAQAQAQKKEAAERKKPVTATDFAESMREKLKERKRTLEEAGGDGAANEEEEQLRREILEMHKKRDEDDGDGDQPRSYIQAQRAKYLAKKKVHGSYVEKQRAIAARVEAFKQQLKDSKSAPAATTVAAPEAPTPDAANEGPVAGGARADDWKTHELKFEQPELKKTTVDAVLKAAEAKDDQYVVYDPLSGKVPTVGGAISRHKQQLLGQKKGMDKW